MIGQDITADVAEVGERLSCTDRRTPQVTLKTGTPADFRRASPVSACTEAGGDGPIGVVRLAPHQQVTGPEPACWGVDPEVFFGPADSPAGRPRHLWERRALAVCADCPVVNACLAEALEFPAAEQYGVVGGMTAGQRRAALRTPRRGRGRAPRPRKGGQDVFALLGGQGRPMRSSGPAVTPAAGGSHRGPRPARP